jgi:FKBP-type peptidyl-prolyl cis-trans isomerase FklB
MRKLRHNLRKLVRKISPMEYYLSSSCEEKVPFAEMAKQCENSFMKKLFVTIVTVLLVGMLLLGNATAQQTPAATPSKTPAAKASPSAATKAPAAKTGESSAAAEKTPAAKSAGGMELKTEKDKLSYAVGLNVGRSLQKDSVEVDPNVLVQGLKDALAGGKTQMSEDDARGIIQSLQADLHKKQEAQMAAAGEANKKQGDAFMAANKTKEGVVTLPDGLQYKILTAGTGPKPTASDTVNCNYKGTLIDGTEFDSSYKRGQPATFPVNKVIAGWTEALQLMPVGSKWQLFVPPDMAYGARGPSPLIGSNAVLIFEVELLSIKEKEAK